MTCRGCLLVAVVVMWGMVAMRVLVTTARTGVSEHEKTRDVLGKKIDNVERLLTDRQVAEAERLVRVAESHVEVLANASSTTEKFRVSLHSVRQWSREYELVLKDGVPAPSARDGSKPVIDYYVARCLRLREAMAAN